MTGVGITRRQLFAVFNSPLMKFAVDTIRRCTLAAVSLGDT